MLKKKMVLSGVVVALATLAPSVLVAATVENRAIDIVGAGAAADPLIAIEANRTAIVNRLVAEHRATLFASGIPESSFRNALQALRADQLLAASLVEGFAEITAIVSQSPIDGAALQRFVAMTPNYASALGVLPAASAYLVRDGDTLSMVRAGQLQLTDPQLQVVGYFVSGSGSVGGVATGVTPKDGSGSGANSWIGYVAGGNQASGAGSAVAAGISNTAGGQNSFVGAGQSNVASGDSSLVSGGFDNRATATESLVGGGVGNRATGAQSVVVGGAYNLASGRWSFVGGGGRDTGVGGAGTSDQDNIASGDYSAIAGGQGHRATGVYSFAGGGHGNVATGPASTVGGGEFNAAHDSTSTIGGGASNITFDGTASTIGGGYFNAATGDYSTIGGGMGNVTVGAYSTAAGGEFNVAGGDYSFAAGRRARTQSGDSIPVNHHGAFAFGDSSPFAFHTSASNEFAVRATGGTRFVTAIDGSGNPTRAVRINPNGELEFGAATRQMITLWGPGNYGIGVQHFTAYFRADFGFAWFAGGSHANATNDPGGGQLLMTVSASNEATIPIGFARAQLFTSVSDRNAKTNFAPVDAQAILAKVASLPLTTWVYRNDPHVRHIGPMAQDFSNAFSVGSDDKTIATVDADGIALAAIQGLNAKVEANMAELRRENARLRAELAGLQSLHEELASLRSLREELASMRAAMPVARPAMIGAAASAYSSD